MSLSCTLVPAPSFGVEPMRILTCPARTFANSSAFFASVLYSWIKAISSFGIPLAASLFRTSSYTLKVPSPLGVDRSQKTSWVVRSAFPSSHTSVSFQGASFIQRRYGWKFGLPAYLLSAYVGWGRTYAKKHDWWDIIGGAAIGTASSYIFTRPFARKHNITFSPVILSGQHPGFYASIRF